MNTEWEYQVHYGPGLPDEDILNKEYGEGGWELCCIVPFALKDEPYYAFYFKREKSLIEVIH